MWRKSAKHSKRFKQANNTAQNLFLAFGTQFIHLERLPLLSANVSSLYSVIDSTIFALIISIAYIIALIAFFIALLVRMFVLWIAIIASPAIVAASIMGFDQLKDGYTKFVANLLIPLKMAVAFGVSFVMMNGMTEFRPTASSEG